MRAREQFIGWRVALLGQFEKQFRLKILLANHLMGWILREIPHVQRMGAMPAIFHFQLQTLMLSVSLLQRSSPDLHELFGGG